MCGIAGFSGDFDKHLLEKMNTSIAHRGPDDSGIYFNPEKGIGLAHRRLSIIDLSPLGHQPMWDKSQKVAIVYNGEIYNYRELRKELITQGFVFKSHSDTEVLVNLYLRDRGNCSIDLITGRIGFIYHFLQGLWFPFLIDVKYLEMKRNKDKGARGEEKG